MPPAEVDTWEDTLEMISQEWERLPVPLDEVWTYDPQGKVWVEFIQSRIIGGCGR